MSAPHATTAVAHPVLRGGLALAAALATLEPAWGARLTRGPYLQVPTASSLTIVWKTDVPAACGLTIRPSDGSPRTITGGTDAECAIRADELTAGATYRYSPLADGASLAPESAFRLGAPTNRFTFLVFGDSGGGEHQLTVRDAMAATPADFILHTGDMVYKHGEAEHFDPRFFEPYRDIIRRIVLWPCLGNHDIRTQGGRPWRDAFRTPANNPAGSEHYYSFDHGNAHVIVLDSNDATHPGSPQHTFLDQDLAASRATWKMVAFHHPPYSSGRHGSSKRLQTDLVPLFDRHRVDLVFSGHDHHYERTMPLRSGQIVDPAEGTVYVTTGGGGKSIRPVGWSDFTAHAESVFHFTRIAVDGNSLTLTMINEDGKVRDTMAITKGSPSEQRPPPRPQHSPPT